MSELQQLTASLTILERIEQTLDTLRPYIASHRGHVEVVDFDEAEGRLLLRLGGTCHGCAASIDHAQAGHRDAPPAGGAGGEDVGRRAV